MVKALPILDLTRSGPAREVPVWPAAPLRSTEAQDRVAARARARGIEIEEPANSLVLNYTMKCPLACDFCCYASGPRRAETMDLRFALDIVDQAASLGVFGAFGFTGGDPFVFHEDLVVISRRIAEHHIPFSAISACAWATSDYEIRRHLEPLIENGMTDFVVSHDPSHGHWVSRDQVRNVVQTAVQMGLKVSVFATFYDEDERLEDQFPEFADAENVTLEGRLVGPGIGRVRHARMSRSQFPKTDFDSFDTCYQRVYHDITVFWDGETYPCCSAYNRATPGISYGNLYEEPLWRVWDRIEGSRYLRLIQRRGFAELYMLLERIAPDLHSRLPRHDSGLGACHLCHLIMSDTDLSREIHDVLSREELAGAARPRGTASAGEDGRSTDTCNHSAKGGGEQHEG